MATVKQAFVVEQMRKEKMPFFTVSDNTTVIGENDGQENVETAIQDLEEVLSQIKNPYVDVRICDTTKGVIARGGNRQKFRKFRVELAGEVSKVTTSASPDATVLKLMKENDALQRTIDRMESDKRYADLERKVDEMRREDVLSKLFSNPAMINGIGNLLGVKNPMGIASVEGAETVNAPAAERQQKIRTAVLRLCAVDTHFDDTVTMLADLAEASRSQYFEAVELLKSMNHTE